MRAMARALNAIRERLLDGADLLIDFATLGEYGLEPSAPAASPPCRQRACRASRPTRDQERRCLLATPLKNV